MSEALKTASKLSAKGVPFDTVARPVEAMPISQPLIHRSPMSEIPEEGGLALGQQQPPTAAAIAEMGIAAPPPPASGQRESEFLKVFKCLLGRLLCLVKFVLDGVSATWRGSTPETIVPVFFLLVLAAVLYKRYTAKQRKDQASSAYSRIDNPPFEI